MITRFWAESVTALATLVFGLVIVYGALDFGVGWDSSGPQPGAFPFYTGLIVALASAGTLAITAARQLGGSDALREISLDRSQLGRVVSFFLPLLAFVVLSSLAGMYVAAIAYLLYAMRVQGGYGWAVAVASALGTAVIFYVVFEKLFQIGLLKGPVEAWLGL